MSAAPSTRPGLVRRGTRALVWAFSALGVVAAPLPYIDAGGLLPAVQALAPIGGLVGVGIVLLALWARAFIAAGLACAATLALLVPVLPLAPRPPAGGGPDLRILTINNLEEWAHVTHSAEPRLVITGDLNAGPPHPAIRSLMRGLVQAPRAWPWQPTWPQESRYPPFVQLDHILARRFTVMDEGTVVIPGTDHAGVWATLRQR